MPTDSNRSARAGRFIAAGRSIAIGTAAALTLPCGPAASQELPAVEVTATKPPVPDTELPPTKPTTVYNREELERRQAENIFEVVRDTPGVMIEGGPRASGMRFNIRGFSDNEDVVFKIDGAVKGFEKYRFGGGVFIEPELLKSLEIERGPSLTSGSGALGGTVSVTTKSASDLLRPGQRIGALTKFGYNWNNRERLRMASVYGRPNGYVDLLASVARRDSDDVRQANGDRVAVSAIHSESSLLKATFYPIDHLSIDLSRIAYEAGPERAPYDATAGGPGVGGIVQRTIDDETLNLRLRYAPPDSIVNLRGTLARERTHLHDHHLRGESSICATSAIVPYCDDRWRYDIWTAELFNDARYRIGPLDGVLTIGYQGIRNQRDVTRVSASDLVNSLQYPGGFNEAQPPGDKVSHAVIVENPLTWGHFTLQPGLRWDRYTVSARKQARTNMELAGQTPDISFSKVSKAAAVSWRIGGSPWTLTYRYNEAFRPPLIDEYFARANFGSRCKRTEINPRTGRPYSPPGEPLYNPATGVDLAPMTGICGDLYRPQESYNNELILAWASRRQGPHDDQWQARLTYYDIFTRYLLTSISNVDDTIRQPGQEKRHGVELEVHYASRRWFASASYGKVSGSISNPATGSGQAIYGVPGNTLMLSAGIRAFDQRVEAGARMRNIGDRQAYVSSTATACTSAGTNIPGVGYIGTQYGVRLWDLYASWQPTAMLTFRASVDNLTNETYCLIDGFGGAAGAIAPGRSLRLTMAIQF